MANVQQVTVKTRNRRKYILDGTNPEWAVWVQPIVRALKAAPRDIGSIKKYIRNLGRGRGVPGGVLNGVAWLENNGHAECRNGIWSLTESGLNLTVDPAQSHVTVRFVIQEICEKHGATVADALGQVNFGPAVTARDEICHTLASAGMKVCQIVRATGLAAPRVRLAIDRYAARGTRGQA